MSSPSHKSQLNAQLVLIRKVFQEKQPFDQIKSLILEVHAHLHAKAMSGSVEWSYQDEVLASVPVDWMRIKPEGEDHSIAWLLWHLTRCEDITMNLLVAETAQVLFSGGWFDAMNTPCRDTGNAMSPEEITDFSQGINLDALFDYRMSVGGQTQNIIHNLQQADVYRKMKPSAVQRIFDEEAVVQEAAGIVDYWSKRDVSGLLLMPATRHQLTHLNEALGIRNKIKKMAKR